MWAYRVSWWEGNEYSHVLMLGSEIVLLRFLPKLGRAVAPTLLYLHLLSEYSEYMFHNLPLFYVVCINSEHVCKSSVILEGTPCTGTAMHEYLLNCELVCACVMLLPKLTAGEDEGTGVFVHWEIMELQLAFCVDGHPEEGGWGGWEKRYFFKRRFSQVSFSGPLKHMVWCTGFLTARMT